jgi:hypothetical protein
MASGAEQILQVEAERGGRPMLWQWSFWWLAAVAAGGGLMAVQIALKRPIPSWMGSGHGLAALAGLVLLFVANLRGEDQTPPTAWWALGLFTAGMVGGLILFRVLFPQRAPLGLAVLHGSLGAVGLILLGPVALA